MILQYNCKNEEDRQAIVRIWQQAVGDRGTVVMNDKGIISFNDYKSPTEPKEKTVEDHSAHLLNKLISDNNTTAIEVVRDSEEVLIGDINTATIDIGDIDKMDSYMNRGAVGGLIHESVEQYMIQSKGLENTRAHVKATGVESIAAAGNTLNPNRPIDEADDKGSYINYRYTKKLQIDENGKEIWDKTIKIYYKDNNLLNKSE